MKQIAIARGRYLRHSPQKSKLVLDQIRGADVEDAFHFLKFCTRSAARDIEKILKSAVANAQQNLQNQEQYADIEADTNDMYVSLADVGPGPSMKRWRARARGRAVRILKRTAHITLAVGLREGE
jgi:large subunit ribosomal protein L22